MHYIHVHCTCWIVDVFHNMHYLHLHLDCLLSCFHICWRLSSGTQVICFNVIIKRQKSFFFSKPPRVLVLVFFLVQSSKWSLIQRWIVRSPLPDRELWWPLGGVQSWCKVSINITSPLSSFPSSTSSSTSISGRSTILMQGVHQQLILHRHYRHFHYQHCHHHRRQHFHHHHQIDCQYKAPLSR